MSKEKLPVDKTAPPESFPGDKKPSLRPLLLGILGAVLTVGMIAAIIIWNDKLRDLEKWKYLGAFVISILGGATIIVPVPMLPVVFALGAAMTNPWQVFLLGLAAAAGEVIGGITIYMTGRGAGEAISKNGKIQKAYERMLRFIKRWGVLALFLVTFIVNPFFYPAAFASGALRMGLKKFIPVVIIGKLIKCMTVVYAGYFGLNAIFHALGISL